MNHGIAAHKDDTLSYIEYHGNKGEVKAWVKSLGFKFTEVFKNIPFGGMKWVRTGQKVETGYILVDNVGNFDQYSYEEFGKQFNKL